MPKIALFFFYFLTASISHAQILRLDGKRDSLTRTRITWLLETHRSANKKTQFEEPVHYTFIIPQQKFLHRSPEYSQVNYFGTSSAFRNHRNVYLPPARYKFMDVVRERQRSE